jgi:hypothetical protein
LRRHHDVPVISDRNVTGVELLKKQANILLNMAQVN